ncbi:MAG: hypothetical protein J5J06_15445 [Phycisphaerae bacterium]|nr:hypothetical protein [Phycisphaerae bacterium]
MARGNRNSRSRGDITETVEKHDQEYKEKTEALERDAEDHRVESEVIDGMEAGGTSEGVEEVTASLQEAKETTEQEFADDGAALEQAQGEGEEFEGELKERTESDEGDLQKIGDARQQVHSDSATSRIEQAESETREDIEFLQGEEERSRQSRENAQQQHEQLKQIVQGTGG